MELSPLYRGGGGGGGNRREACRPQQGLVHFNYKKSHLIVSLVVCNANYEFLLLDIGDTRRNSNGGVFANFEMGIAIERDLLKISVGEEIKNTGINFPFSFLSEMKLFR